ESLISLPSGASTVNGGATVPGAGMEVFAAGALLGTTSARCAWAPKANTLRTAIADFKTKDFMTTVPRKEKAWMRYAHTHALFDRPQPDGFRTAAASTARMCGRAVNAPRRCIRRPCRNTAASRSA